MDTITGNYANVDENSLRQAVQKVYDEWVAFIKQPNDVAIVPVMDETNHRYLLQNVSMMRGNRQGLQYSRTLAHLEIRNGKIRIEADGTEEGIAGDLMRYGVPKDKIVLAFYPKKMREMGDFPVD